MKRPCGYVLQFPLKARCSLLLLCFTGLGLLLVSSTAVASKVKSAEQDVMIPTYLAGDPEPNPMFYFGRGSQGAQGRVYPYPLYDTLTDIKSNKVYRAVYLENEYVRVGILPEIGGRLFEAVDKSNGYNFIYRQHVIKPALIGLIGAWISGGIEWNIPHHHRATTFLPVQYRIESNDDGSQTVWVGELELRQRMRWAVGYTLHPGKSYLECSIRIVNRTPVQNTMLCFANVAVHVNRDYQVIYPQDTQFVTFHSKREFTTWPIATTRYAGADFTRGVDVSWYSNHMTANSMFAWNYADDFFAGYDHGREAGIISVAEHHVVPGKKFWTWGNGQRGRMWDKILTDADGPYIELMVGAYSDNQPDYSWLAPYETRSFQIFWYPFRGIGGVKKANLDAAVNLEVATNNAAKLGFCTTSAHGKATVILRAGDQLLLQDTVEISPARPFERQIILPPAVSENNLRAALLVDGKELVSYAPAQLEPAKMPEPVKPPGPPADMKTVEELYLAGQRVEQFYSPDREPEPYWEEALRRDPDNARVHTAMGIRKFKQARFSEAEDHFRKAIARLTANYTSPKDSEPLYYLGLALQAQALVQCGCRHSGRSASGALGAGTQFNNGNRDADQLMNEAYDAFYKAAWSQAWKGPAYFGLAEIDTWRQDLATAREHIDRSLDANGSNLRALTLKAALLRHSGDRRQALGILDLTARQTDPLDARIMTERSLAGDRSAGRELAVTFRAHPAAGLETAVEYGNAGLYEDAITVLELILGEAGIGSPGKSATTITGKPGSIGHSKIAAAAAPLACYYLAEFAEELGRTNEASEYCQRARRLEPDYVFPFQWEVIPALRQAGVKAAPDARAPYYLGNLLYDWQPEEAVKLWQESAGIDPSFAMVHRNLGLAYWHQKPTNDLAHAVVEYEMAVSAPVKYALNFAELDELYAATAAAPEKRLALLEQNHAVVSRRDDALSREVGLKVFAGKYDEAIRMMTGRRFSVWEGGSLEVVEHWINAHLLRGRQELRKSNWPAALADLQAAGAVPDNLPTERESGRKAEVAYWRGVAFEGEGDTVKARQAWQEAATAPSGGRRSGSSHVEAQSYFQAMARRKLGQTTEAEAQLHDLVETAGRGMTRDAAVDPTRERSRIAAAHYSAGLGNLGLGNKAKAKAEFEAALQALPDMLGAKVELTGLVESGWR